jgi:hypothetical protein
MTFIFSQTSRRWAGFFALHKRKEITTLSWKIVLGDFAMEKGSAREKPWEKRAPGRTLPRVNGGAAAWAAGQVTGGW